jgi:hypothetical protein
MIDGRSSRRDFLMTSGAFTAGAGLTLSLAGCGDAAARAAEAVRNGEAPRVLTDPERRTLEAISDGILPPDGASPGAAAMGAVVFMDHYAADRPDLLEGLRGALAVVKARVVERRPDAEDFEDLEQADAEAVLAALAKDSPPEFQLLHMMVVFGAFAAPARGGNLDEAGWALLGYQDQHAWQPPFGFYDEEAARGGTA